MLLPFKIFGLTDFGKNFFDGTSMSFAVVGKTNDSFHIGMRCNCGACGSNRSVSEVHKVEPKRLVAEIHDKPARIPSRKNDGANEIGSDGSAVEDIGISFAFQEMDGNECTDKIITNRAAASNAEQKIQHMYEDETSVIGLDGSRVQEFGMPFPFDKMDDNENIVKNKTKCISIESTCRKIYAIDPLLKGYSEHLEDRYKKYGKLHDAIENQEGGLEVFSRGYEKFGFVKCDTGIYYREWAPGAKRATLIGDFNNWNPGTHIMKKNISGIWEIFLPNKADGSPQIPHKSRVKVRMVTESGIKDSIPSWIKFSVQSPGEIHFNGIYYDPPTEERYNFKNLQPKRPKSLRIYEAHVGMSSMPWKEGNEVTAPVFVPSLMPFPAVKRKRNRWWSKNNTSSSSSSNQSISFLCLRLLRTCPLFSLAMQKPPPPPPLAPPPPRTVEQHLQLPNSGNISSFSSTISRDDEDISRSALSTFKAKEDEIEKKKLEVRDKVHAELGRVEEETKRLALIREELETLADPLKKELALVRKKIDSINRELKPLGQICQKKEKEYKEALDYYNDKNREKVALIGKMMELVGESEKSRMKKLEELSKSIDRLHRSEVNSTTTMTIS